jgi:PPOX class probable FMN-dependent enzyme
VTDAGFSIRAATTADAPLLAKHRVGMFRDMGLLAGPPDAAEEMERACARSIAGSLARREWKGRVAEEGGAPVGSGCWYLRPMPPAPRWPAGGTEAYLLNFYVEPGARRRGVASAILRACVDAARAEGALRLALHASTHGRPVYAAQGFRPREGEMVLVPESAGAPAAAGHRLTPRVIRDEATLRALLGSPAALVAAKVVPRLTPLTRRFIELAPFVCLGTSAADGSCDVSPRGDPAGFVRILDDATLLLPDRPGNRIADSLRNILSNPRVGLLFVIPGVTDSFRVDGRATLTDDPALLAPCAVDGKVPRLGILVDIEHAYTQCGKALLRSRLWDPAGFVDPAALPTSGAIHAEREGDGFDAEAYDAARRERYGRREGFY